MKTVIIAGAAALSLYRRRGVRADLQRNHHHADNAATGCGRCAAVAGRPEHDPHHASQDAYGNQVNSQSTTYRNSDGVAQDSTTTTRTVPPPVVSSSTTTETTTQHN